MSDSQDADAAEAPTAGSAPAAAAVPDHLAPVEAAPVPPPSEPAPPSWTSPSAPAVVLPSWPAPTPAAPPPTTSPYPTTPPYPTAPLPNAAHPSAPPAPTAPPAAGVALAVTTIVLGALAMLFALVPFLCFAAFLPALAGIVTGIVALARRGRLPSLSASGLALSVIAIPVAIALCVVTGTFVASIGDEVEKSGGFEQWVEENGDTTSSSGSVQFRGTGNDNVDVTPVDGRGELGYARITSTGTGIFMVIGRDSAGDVVERMLDVTGSYDGSVLWNIGVDYEVTSFEIIGDGDWTVSVQGLDDVPEIEAGSDRAGSHDAVFWYGGSDTSLTLTPHDRASGYIWATSSSEPWLCESHGDPCTSDLPGDGGAFVQIYSDGKWDLHLDLDRSTSQSQSLGAGERVDGSAT